METIVEPMPPQLQTAPFDFRMQKHIVRLRGLPFEVTAEDIRAFFGHLSILEGGIRLVDNGYGDALVAFATEEDARCAIALSGQYIGRRYVVVCWASATDIESADSDAISQHCPRITQELLNKVEDRCLNTDNGFGDLALLVREFPTKLPLYLKNGLYRVLMKVSAKAIASCKTRETVPKYESYLAEPTAVVQLIEILKLAIARGVFSEKQCIQFDMIIQQLLQFTEDAKTNAQFTEQDLMKMMAHIWDAPDDPQHDMLRIPEFPLQNNVSHISVSSTLSEPVRHKPQITPENSPRGHIGPNSLRLPVEAFAQGESIPRQADISPRSYESPRTEVSPRNYEQPVRIRQVSYARHYDDSVIAGPAHYVEYRGMPSPMDNPPLRRQSSEPSIPWLPSDRLVNSMPGRYRAPRPPQMMNNNEIYYVLPDQTVVQQDGTLKVMMVNTGARSLPNSPRNQQQPMQPPVRSSRRPANYNPGVY